MPLYISVDFNLLVFKAQFFPKRVNIFQHTRAYSHTSIAGLEFGRTGSMKVPWRGALQNVIDRRGRGLRLRFRYHRNLRPTPKLGLKEAALCSSPNSHGREQRRWMFCFIFLLGHKILVTELVARLCILMTGQTSLPQICNSSRS